MDNVILMFRINSLLAMISAFVIIVVIRELSLFSYHYTVYGYQALILILKGQKKKIKKLKNNYKFFDVNKLFIFKKINK